MTIASLLKRLDDNRSLAVCFALFQPGLGGGYLGDDVVKNVETHPVNPAKITFTDDSVGYYDDGDYWDTLPPGWVQ